MCVLIACACIINSVGVSRSIPSQGGPTEADAEGVHTGSGTWALATSNSHLPPPDRSHSRRGECQSILVINHLYLN